MATYTTLSQLGVNVNQDPISEDVSRLSTEFPIPAAGYGLNVVGDPNALLATDQNAPPNGTARYLKISYNGTDLWVCCSQVHVP